ncbi:hypothetical protein TorRG33x02_296600, partial [Trema orientale]
GTIGDCQVICVITTRNLWDRIGLRLCPGKQRILVKLLEIGVSWLLMMISLIARSGQRCSLSSGLGQSSGLIVVGGFRIIPNNIDTSNGLKKT